MFIVVRLGDRGQVMNEDCCGRCNCYKVKPDILCIVPSYESVRNRIAHMRKYNSKATYGVFELKEVSIITYEPVEQYVSKESYQPTPPLKIASN
jgi:hypothetical protein